VKKVYKKDALDFLADLPSNSVDLVISSPPYFMGKEYDRSRNLADFVETHERLLCQLVRFVKSGGSICWQVGHHVKNNVVVPLDCVVYNTFLQSEELRLRNRIIWYFGHGAHCPKRFSGRHETVLWYTKGDDFHFNLNAVRVPQKYPGKKHYKGLKRGQPSGNPLGKNPGDVWEIPNVKAGHVEKTSHPCQFPIALAQRLVKALCPKDGLVIDPFLGSGSTGIAAVLEGRAFKGCDLQAKYVRIAQLRLKQLETGKLKIRPLDQPIHIPGTTDSVAMIPPQWTKNENGIVII
jgi:adenine-specific DNA-methyltransferase